jgi:hypothetical protein
MQLKSALAMSLCTTLITAPTVRRDSFILQLQVYTTVHVPFNAACGAPQALPQLHALSFGHACACGWGGGGEVEHYMISCEGFDMCHTLQYGQASSGLPTLPRASQGRTNPEATPPDACTLGTTHPVRAHC